MIPIEKLAKTLSKQGVKFAIVGGYAVALHGAIRGTVDIDLVISLDEKQFEAAQRALESLGLASRLPVSSSEVFHFRDEYIRNRNLTAWSFINPDNPLDIVDIIITHDFNDITVVQKKLGKQTLPVIAIPDLIAMKRTAGRPQDIEDIKALEKLQ